jgi:hypothetical protein
MKLCTQILKHEAWDTLSIQGGYVIIQHPTNFLVSTFKNLPTTSWPMDRHCVFILVQSSFGHTFNNSIPQLWQSPMIQLLVWNSTLSSLTHNIQVHIEINVLYVSKWVLQGGSWLDIVQLRFIDILTRTYIVIMDALS